MRDDDPLEQWLVISHYKGHKDVVAHHQAATRQGIDELGAWLDSMQESKPGQPPRLHTWSSGAIPPAQQDVEDTKTIYLRLLTISGAGLSFVEEELLGTLAATQDVANIPFWVQLLDLSRPRDRFAQRRRTIALAALAFVAMKQAEPAALAALRAAMHHSNPQVRALAVYYLGRAYQGYENMIELDEALENEAPLEAPPDLATRIDILMPPVAGDFWSEELLEPAERPPAPIMPVPDDVAAELAEIAAHDKSFEPRFLARQVLRRAGQPMPSDNPNGSYAFKVKLKWDKRTYRTIELRSKHTLADLQQAIQRALRWDNDHLFSFYMNGQRGDERYEFVSPWDNEGPAWVDEAVIGELGLAVKHKFLYLFDYGDQHEFEIEVVGIRQKAEPGKYPRVIDSQGKIPRQYHRYDEDEDEEWEL